MVLYILSSHLLKLFITICIIKSICVLKSLLFYRLAPTMQNEVIVMIDYKTIGAKIRKRRISCNLSQEKLAELCDVGTTHISHIETGNCIPSLKVFIAILNALSCSADELLCDELNRAEYTYISEITQILEDCSSHELMIITDTIQALKSSLRK